MKRSDKERIALAALGEQWRSVRDLGSTVKREWPQRSPGALRDVLDGLADAGRCQRRQAAPAVVMYRRAGVGPIKPPARPCGSCPYRRDVPSGVWAEEEYEKLPPYDGPTAEQPPTVFMCHQQDGRLCAGWCGCHDMNESLGLRVAGLTGELGPEDAAAVLGYETDAPLFSSGAEAAAHGLAEMESPPPAARRTIARLRRKRPEG